MGQVTGPLAGQSGVPIPVAARYFFKTSVPSLGPRYGLLVSWYRGSFLKVKRPERGVGYSLPPSGEVKDDRSYTSAPCTHLHGMPRKRYLHLLQFYTFIYIYYFNIVIV
jgi:hypothetical protein